jgi:putative heme iron utilization protein
MAGDYGGLRNQGEQMMARQDGPASDGSAGWEARQLLRAARVGTLATSAGGQPFASLVTPACMPDGALLLLLSRLSEHTRHLMADPRCSVLLAGAPNGPNPQTMSRVTVTGVAEVSEDPVLKTRYLTIHPYAALYADFTDFATWRLFPAAGQLVGGFARAHRLKAAELVPDPKAVAAIAAAEARIISHSNADHATTLTAIAGEPGAWRMVTVDVDGFDLALGERVIRIAWAAPVRSSQEVRQELVRMAEAAGTH